MALVRNHERIAPITIDEALLSVDHIILDVVKKNRTLIDYYIYPKKTPPDIDAYKPRLQILYTRVESLAALDLSKLTLLVDDAAALVSAFLLPIIDQLLNAIYGIQEIFINHYDRGLKSRKPYGAAYETLIYRKKQLKRFYNEQMTDMRRKLPESLTYIPRGNAESMFCRYAVAFANRRDQGKISQVQVQDLTSDDKERLQASGGAFLSWDCPGCSFRLKYHIVSSVSSSILSTDDVRCHSSVPEVEYRPSWLVKCHLHQASSKNGQESGRVENGRRRSSTTEVRRGSTSRRQSDSKTPRSSGIFWFGGPRRSKSDVTKKTTSIRVKETGPKYGCPFCFVTGKEIGNMNYRYGRELAEHIATKHHFQRPPSALMLERYRVGLDGKCAGNIRRWDLNIRPWS